MDSTSSSGQAPPWLPRAALTVSGVLLGVFALVWVVGRLRSLIVMIFVALFTAIALEPAVQRLERRGWRRGIATGFVFLVTFVAIVAFIASLVPVIVTQADALVDALPGYADSLERWVEAQDFVDAGVIIDQVLGGVEDLGGLASRLGSRLAGGVLAIGNTVIGGVFMFVTVGLFAFYMVADAPRMRSTVLSFLPAARQRELLRIWEIAVEKTGGYIYSRLVLAIVAAGFAAGVFALLGLPYVVALAIWVGVVSQFVPVVGAYIAAFLPVLVALGSRPIAAVWVIVALIVYQQVENYFVAPRITARSMSLHPAVSLGAVIAGASLLGGLGAVLALPVAATIQAFLSTVMARHELVDGSAASPPDGAVADQRAVQATAPTATEEDFGI